MRYPPLAFWMQETKVHDKHGGAIAIQRPAPSPVSLPHSKPPLHAGPAPLARGPSRGQAGAHARQPAAPVTHSQATTKPEPQAEVQSQNLKGSGLSEVGDEGGEGAAKQVQRSKKRRATSPDAALTVLPPDPPSSPFPYPILAKRAPQATLAAPQLHGIKQAAHKHTAAAQSQPPPDAAAGIAADLAAASKKPSSKGKAKRLAAATASASQAPTAAAAMHGDTAHRHSNNEAEAGASSAAHNAAAGSKGTAGKAGGGSNTASARPKRCGTCKNCLQKSAKQGCLVLRAAREQAQAPASPAHQEPPPAAAELTKSPQPTSTATAAKAKPTATAAAVTAAIAKPTVTVTTAKPIKAAQAKVRHKLAVQEGVAEAGVKGSKGGKGDKAKAGRGAARSEGGGRGRRGGDEGWGKGGKACSGPEGSIHSALTQAVELASDMEQPGAVERQHEAAQALEALKHSPVGPAPSQPAAPGVPLTTSSGHTAAAAATAAPPGVGQGEAAAAGPSPAKRGRGRPRKERKPGEEVSPASVGPKRGRGRPPKNPPQPAVTDVGQVSGSGEGLPAVAQPRASQASAMPVKVSYLLFCTSRNTPPCLKHAPWGCMWEVCSLPCKHEPVATATTVQCSGCQDWNRWRTQRWSWQVSQ